MCGAHCDYSGGETYLLNSYEMSGPIWPWSTQCVYHAARGSELSFYTQSVVKDLRAGDRTRFWFPREGDRQVARLGTVIRFVMTGEGEVVRLHVDGRPNYETSMLLTTSVFFVSRP